MGISVKNGNLAQKEMEIDPKAKKADSSTTLKYQHSDQEVCEEVTSQYNPLFIPGKVRNYADADVTIFDDNIGKLTGYQCLGKINQVVI